MAASSYLVTLRIETDQETGDQGITLIIGGAHRGGVSEGRWGFTGGMSTELAHDLLSEVGSALGVALSHSEGHEQMLLI